MTDLYAALRRMENPGKPGLRRISFGGNAVDYRLIFLIKAVAVSKNIPWSHLMMECCRRGFTQLLEEENISLQEVEKLAQKP